MYLKKLKFYHDFITILTLKVYVIKYIALPCEYSVCIENKLKNVRGNSIYKILKLQNNRCIMQTEKACRENE